VPSINYTPPTSAEAVQKLLAQTDWANNRDIDGIQHMLVHSVCMGAWDGAVMVGFARVITDGKYRAFLEDVVVDAAYRGQGIGAGLVRAIMAQLDGIEEIALFCQPHLIEFYAAFGFEPIPHHALHIWRG
jgi:predicted GNAT family N-acyltransferase